MLCAACLLLQPATVGPAAVLAGAGPLNVRGSMSGSHLAPTTRLDWASPSGGLSGSASFTPTALQAAGSGPGFSVRASAVTSNPTAEQARAADTQVGAACHAMPRQLVPDALSRMCTLIWQGEGQVHMLRTH